MKFAMLNVALCCLAPGMAAAQNSNSANSNTLNDQGSQSANVQTVRGCLSQTGNTYVLLGGSPLRQYRVTGGDTHALKHQLGHTIEISGPVGQVQSGASVNGTYGPGSTTGVGYDTIKADSVKEVFGNCG